LFSPGTDSGTFDYFVEHVFENARDLEEQDADALILNAPGIQLSEDDNVLVQGVEGSPYAIGYFGYSYYQENQDRLKALAIDGVEPTEESVNANEYPLSRPLFLYSAATIIAEKPQVADFINYFLTHAGEVGGELGFFPAPVDVSNLAKAHVLIALGMEDQVPAEVMAEIEAEAEATPAA
jgi:phosphate transport system substrate-binding protein